MCAHACGCASWVQGSPRKIAGREQNKNGAALDGRAGSVHGFSSEYEASIHNDPTDMGLTTAFIGKCGPTEPCGCDARGCAAPLFEPVRNAWRKGALSGCGECAPLSAA